MTQLSFDLDSKPTKNARAWMDYHRKNPEVYRLFCLFTQEAIASGRRNYSAQAVIERIRWETEVLGGNDFKLPNAHVAFYARLFMKDHPAHDGFFRTAKSEADNIFDGGRAVTPAHLGRMDAGSPTVPGRSKSAAVDAFY